MIPIKQTLTSFTTKLVLANKSVQKIYNFRFFLSRIVLFFAL